MFIYVLIALLAITAGLAVAGLVRFLLRFFDWMVDAVAEIFEINSPQDNV